MRRNGSNNDPLEPVATSAAEDGGDDRRPFSTAGRYLLADGQEFPCHCVEVSAFSMALSGPMAGPVGSLVIAYLDRLGRVEGFIRRATPATFVIEFAGEGVWRRRFTRRLEDALKEPPKATARTDRAKADFALQDFALQDFALEDLAPLGSPFRSI